MTTKTCTKCKEEKPLTAFYARPRGKYLHGRDSRCIDCVRAYSKARASNLPPELAVWRSMWARCTNPNTQSYKHYGAKGIGVCSRWSTFKNFYADMGPRPSPRHSLDRIDNTRGYSPDNCRWADPRQQANNRGYTRFVTWRGERMPLADAARLAGIRHNTLHGRLRLGWSVERAMTTPVGKYTRRAVQ